MADVSDDIIAAWHLLEITGIIQSVLCALFGTSFSRCHDMNRPRVAVDAHLKPRRRRSVHLAVRSSAVGKPWETERLFAEVADRNDRLVREQLFFVGACSDGRGVCWYRFINLCAHFIARSLQFARARIMNPDPDEFFKWSIPLIVIGKYVWTN